MATSTPAQTEGHADHRRGPRRPRRHVSSRQTSRGPPAAGDVPGDWVYCRVAEPDALSIDPLFRADPAKLRQKRADGLMTIAAVYEPYEGGGSITGIGYATAAYRTGSCLPTAKSAG